MFVRKDSFSSFIAESSFSLPMVAIATIVFNNRRCGLLGNAFMARVPQATPSPHHGLDCMCSWLVVESRVNKGLLLVELNGMVSIYVALNSAGVLAMTPTHTAN